MYKYLLLFICLSIGIALDGQNLQKLDNGIIIKGTQYLYKDYNTEFQIFTLDSTQIEIAQIFRKEFSGDKFCCRAIIQTKINNKIIDGLYFDNFDAVGDSYGICFIKDQLKYIKNYIIGSKYGDYEGLIILIDSTGKIFKESGGNYFISVDRKYLISPWHSDLSGITVFDFEKNKFTVSKELPVHLSKWHINSGKYYAAQWDKNEELNEIYMFDPEYLTFSKTNMNLSELHQFKEAHERGCKPN
jgi:hypothetical protein